MGGSSQTTHDLTVEKIKRRDAMAKDPVCGMEVNEKDASATAEYKGQTYYFCCEGCKRSFERDPDKYIGGK